MASYFSQDIQSSISENDLHSSPELLYCCVRWVLQVHLSRSVRIAGCDLALHSHNLTDLLYSTDRAAVQTHRTGQNCSVMAAAAL